MKGHAKVAAMIEADPGGEVHLQRNGKNCIGYMGKDGVLYYAEIKEVNLDDDGASEHQGTTSTP